MPFWSIMLFFSAINTARTWGIEYIDWITLLSSIVSLVVGIVLIRVKMIEYLVLKDGLLTINRRLVGHRNVFVEDIYDIDVKKRTMIIYLYNGRSVRLKHSWIKDEDFGRLIDRLESAIER